MVTLLEQEAFVGQKPFGQGYSVHGRLSATGLFTTTTSVGSVNVLGVKERATPRIPSGLEHETIRLVLEKKHPWLEDLSLSRAEELAKNADIARSVAQAFAARMEELGPILEVARSVAQERLAYAEGVGRVLEISRSVAEHHLARTWELGPALEIAQSVAVQYVAQLPDVARLAAIAHSAAQEQMTKMEEYSRRLTAIPYEVRQRIHKDEVRETVSPQATEYAKSLGAYGSLVLAKKLVWETFPSLRRLAIDREEDPDEGGHPVIRFIITMPEPVERVIELDDRLLDSFCRDIPARHQPYFAFTYEFGS